MGSFSVTHWLIFLAVVALIFGTSKLKNIGKDVGGAVKDFKNAVNDDEAKHADDVKNRIIDHEDSGTNTTVKDKEEQSS